MRKLVGITRKKPEQAAEALACFGVEDSDSVVPDTPSDAVGPFDSPPGPENMSTSSSSENSSITFVSAPGGDPSGYDGTEKGGDIYDHIDSFENKLESELQDLERFGVSSGATLAPIQEIDTNCEGGSGKSKTSNACSDVTPDSAESEPQKGNGKSGKNLAMLSGKTDKIMSAYQAYLVEIQTDKMSDGFSSSGSEDSFELNEANSALQNVYRARENVRDSYDDRQVKAAEEGDAADSDDGSNAESAGRHKGYAAGSGEPLYRAWGYEDNGSPNENSSVFLSTEGLFHGGKSYNRMYVPHPWLRPRRVRRALCTVMVLVATMGAMGIFHHHKKNRVEINDSLPDLEDEYPLTWRDEDKNGKLQAAMKLESEMEKKVVASLADGSQAEVTPVLSIAEPGGTSPLQEEEAGEQDGQIYEEEQKNNNSVISEVMTEGGMQDGAVEVLEPIIPILPEHHQEDDDASRSVPADTHTFEAVDSYINEEQKVKDQLSPREDAAALIEAQASEMDLYTQAVMKYRPVIFDRSMGWTGRTYRDALLFCEFKGGLAVCPYEAICPDGYNGEPLGGFRENTNSDWAWLPIIGDYNDWVQAGAREKCVRYTEKYGGKGPEWGISGKGQEVEGITRNIMCCLNAM